MNETTAKQNGLNFTGIYARSSDEVKPRLEEIRKQGYKAYIVTIKDSLHSRSACISQGYAVYTEPSYQQDAQAVKYRNSIAAHPVAVQRLRDEFAAKLAAQITELDKADADRRDWLTQHGYSL